MEGSSYGATPLNRGLLLLIKIIVECELSVHLAHVYVCVPVYLCMHTQKERQSLTTDIVSALHCPIVWSGFVQDLS